MRDSQQKQKSSLLIPKNYPKSYQTNQYKSQLACRPLSQLLNHRQGKLSITSRCSGWARQTDINKRTFVYNPPPNPKQPTILLISLSKTTTQKTKAHHNLQSSTTCQLAAVQRNPLLLIKNRQCCYYSKTKTTNLLQST